LSGLHRHLAGELDDAYRPHELGGLGAGEDADQSVPVEDQGIAELGHPLGTACQKEYDRRTSIVSVTWTPIAPCPPAGPPWGRASPPASGNRR